MNPATMLAVVAAVAAFALLSISIQRRDVAESERVRAPVTIDAKADAAAAAAVGFGSESEEARGGGRRRRGRGREEASEGASEGAVAGDEGSSSDATPPSRSEGAGDGDGGRRRPTATTTLPPPPTEFGEPFAGRWGRRFSDAEGRGYLFFKHTRKAGGTSLRSYFFRALEHHDSSRTFDLSPVARAGFESGELDRTRQGEYLRRMYERRREKTEERRRATAKARKEGEASMPSYDVRYVEQEFDAMDWQCPMVDPRWNNSLRVITLRHPIERHFSEFFFSGPGRQHELNKTLLYKNRTYTDELADFIQEHFPLWMKENHAYPQRKKPEGMAKERWEKNQRPFGRYYTDNFQLRSLAGCSSGDCLDEYDLDEAEKDGMLDRLANPADADNCTFYFIAADEPFDSCHKIPDPEACPGGCDGPCFYESLARGPVTREHLVRAARSLDSFDAVLVADRLDDERQSDFVSDLFGTPRDAPFSLKLTQSLNSRVEKTKRREKQRFYRDLLQRLRLHRLNAVLFEENSLEIELFKYAKKLNKNMLNQWEKESAGLDVDVAIETAGRRTPPRSNPEVSLEKSSLDYGEDRDLTTTKTGDQAEDAHDYAVIVVHYHKTGYVLTRFLMKLTIGLEYEAKGRSEDEISKAKRVSGYAVDHVDERTGAAIAFGQRGNWNRNWVRARRHDDALGCQSSFALEKGAIYLQEAPDFYCSDVDLARRMLGYPKQESGKTKIVHFVRNPFEMVLSNYFYHSQDPTPEEWVHTDDPCEFRYGDGKSLASHVLPTISPRTKITRKHLDAVVAMCHSLYQSKPRSKNATFYEHLLKLNHRDGLRLATAQMVIASSKANRGLAGGDVLRMAQNIVKFQNLRTSPSVPFQQRENLHLRTISMDDYIASPKNVTLKFLDFVLGGDDSAVPRDAMIREAEGQDGGAKKKKKNKHVTQGKHENKDELRQLLRDDPVLGPILSEVEILVDEALDQNDRALS